MNDIIKIADGTNPPTSLVDGQLAIDEANRILYVPTNRGAVAMPLDRIGIEPVDETASSEVYVYRDSGTAEHVELAGGGGGPGRDDREWRVFGFAPMSLDQVALPHSGIIEINQPTVINGLQVLVVSGSGTVSVSFFNWDGSQGSFLAQEQIVVSGAGDYQTSTSITLDPGRYEVLTEGDGITLEALSGVMPWESDVTHCVNMAEL